MKRTIFSSCFNDVDGDEDWELFDFYGHFVANIIQDFYFIPLLLIVDGVRTKLDARVIRNIIGTCTHISKYTGFCDTHKQTGSLVYILLSLAVAFPVVAKSLCFAPTMLLFVFEPHTLDLSRGACVAFIDIPFLNLYHCSRDAHAIAGENSPLGRVYHVFPPIVLNLRVSQLFFFRSLINGSAWLNSRL